MNYATNTESKATTTLTENRYLCFSLADEEYAIPLLSVREVIAVPEITPVPYTPPHFLGIMNLRGQVISVMDLRHKFNIKSKNSSETAVIICQFEGFSIGVVVDSVNSVLTPSAENLSPKPEMQSQKATDYITGVYRKEKRLVLFLDIAKTLNVDDHKAISGGLKNAA